MRGEGDTGSGTSLICGFQGRQVSAHCLDLNLSLHAPQWCPPWKDKHEETVLFDGFPLAPI